MVRGKGIRFIVAMVASAVLILGFQNCTPRVYLSSNSHESEEAVSGNGGTYDGKPEPGDYVRQYPNGCPGGASPNVIGKMSISTLSGRITEDLCVQQDYAFSFSDDRLVYSDYNWDYIGFNSAIFESARVHQESTAPVEVWCRHSTPDEGLDLVIKTNGLGLMYRGADLRSGAPQTYPRQVFTVQRAASAQSLTFTSSQPNISLVVDLAAPQGLTFAAQASLRFGGQDTNLALACRVMSPDPAVYSAPMNILAIFQMESSVASSTSGVGSILLNPDGLGAGFVAGRYGLALKMDGEDDYVDVSGLAPLVTSAGSFTISIWLRPDFNIADDTAAFTVNSNDGGHNLFKFGTGHCSGSGDRLNLTLEVGSGCYDAGLLVDGLWHQVTLVASASRVILYLDGVERVNESHSETMAIDDRWSLGQDLDGANATDFWFGLMDEVVVWNRALSPAEI